MTDEALEFHKHLPLSFKTESEQEYIQFLWEAFESNYENKKHQFAFLAYHMLAMSFVYFNIWQIRHTKPKDFAMGLIGFCKDIEICLGFDLESLAAQADHENMRDLHEVLRAKYGSENAGGAV